MFVADSLTRLTSKDIGNSSFIFLIFCHCSQPCSLADETAAFRLFSGGYPRKPSLRTSSRWRDVAFKANEKYTHCYYHCKKLLANDAKFLELLTFPKGVDIKDIL